MTVRRTHPRILIVEGKDELRVLPEMLELAGIPWPKGAEPVRIEEQDGVANILAPAFIETTLKASGVKAVGIVVDANGDPAARWEALRVRLATIFATFPTELPLTGVIHEVGRQLHDAVRSRTLPPAPPVTDTFVAWFRRLFDV